MKPASVSLALGILTTVLLSVLPAPTVPVPPDANALPCTGGHFLSESNSTCLPCPENCAECLPHVSAPTYPCRACHQGAGLVLPPRDTEPDVRDRKWTFGGACQACADTGWFESAGGGGRFRLNLVGAHREEGYEMEGRLEVRGAKGVWGAVCDDGWGMRESDVVCGQLGLGIGVGYDTQYDLLHPYLPELNILMDDVNCTGMESSLHDCEFIGGSLQNCEVTETVGVRCSGPELQGPYCIEQCPLGKYPDISSGICQNCSGQCLACAGPGSSGQCTACQDPFFLMPVTVRKSQTTGDCQTDCPPGLYGNLLTRRCQQCSRGCESCLNGISGDTCTSCASDFLLFESACVSGCPAGTILHVDGSGACVKACPEGFYAGEQEIPPLASLPATTSSLRCLKCASECLHCQNEVNNCTLCQRSHVLQPLDVKLQSVGSNAHKAPSFSCQSQCENGFYPDANDVCRPCRDNHCDNCFRGGVYCMHCTMGYYVQLGRCVRNCTSGLYPIDGTCIFPCPDGFYGNMTTEKCEPCAPGCRTCVLPGKCTGCYGGRFLLEGACVKECREGYLSVTYPRKGGLRLMGGPNSLDGRVEIYHEGVWKPVCAGTGAWSLTAANTACQDLQKGRALQTTTDGHSGPTFTNLTSELRCHGNESSILECDVTNQTCDAKTLIAVFCSGPDLGRINECHMINTESCDQTPCAEGVRCTDLPPGGGGSRCGQCPIGATGDGRTCRKTETGRSAEPVGRLLFPPRPQVIAFWPEHVQLTLPVVTAGMWQTSYVTWYKDGVKITTSKEYRQEEWGGLTLLNPSGRQASGQYSCDIVTGTGNLTALFTVSVQEVVSVTIEPRSQIIKSRGAALSCQGQGHPSPEVTWVKDGHPVQSVTAEVSRQGTLVLRDVSASDAGRYGCVMTNGFTQAVAYADLTVEAPAHIVKKSAYTTAIIGGSLSLMCDVIGGPNPQVYWKKDSEDLPSTDRIQVKGTKLIISEVNETDSGIYRCVARNAAGSDVWKTNLTVLVPPKATISPEAVAVAMGTGVSFRCQVTGRPLPTVTWYRGDAILEPDAQVATSGDVSTLTLANVRPDDAGQVTCRAHNDAGTVAVSANLTVPGPPQWDSEPRDVWALDGWGLTLGWGVHASPPATLVWFRDGLELRASSRYTIDETGLSFTGRYPSDSGVYTIQATNTEGTIVGSGHLEIVNALPMPTVRQATPTNVTLFMGILPARVSDSVFEILVVRMGNNESRMNLTTSPLDVVGQDPQPYLMSNVTNTSEGYVGLIFDRLPRLITVGDGKRYASATTKRSVLNAPLVPGEWLAVAVRLVRYTSNQQQPPGPPWTEAIFPVGATNYTTFFTAHSGSLGEVSSDNSLQTAAGVVLGVVLSLALVSLAFCVFYWRRKGHVPCPTLHHLVLLGRALKERTLHTTEYMSKFSPHPSSGQFKPEPLGGTRGTSSETISTSVSTVYIPTEDEIDSLESIGIHYYEDDNWMSRVPSGVLSISQSRLNKLRHSNPEIDPLSPALEPRPSTSRDESSGYLHRTLSEPSLQSTPGKKTRAVSVLERTSSDPSMVRTDIIVPGTVFGEVTISYEDRSSSMRKKRERSKERRLGSVLRRGKTKLAVQKTPSTLSRDSKFSDSGFESEQKGQTDFNKIGGSLKWRNLLRPFPTKSSHQSEIPQSELETGVSSAQGTPKKIIKRRRRLRVKHFRSWRDKSLRSLRDRGSNLLSRGRKWAKHVLDRHDAYGIQKSEDSDSSSDGRGSENEARQPKVKPVMSQKDKKNPTVIDSSKKPAKRMRTNDSNTKGSDNGSSDCVYIDPSSVVSIPLRKMHSSGKSAPKTAIKAIKSFPVTNLDVRGSAMASAMPQDLEQFRPKTGGKRKSKNSQRQEKVPVSSTKVNFKKQGLSSPKEKHIGAESPVVMRMIGKLQNRKDAEAQTDSELDEDSENEDSTGSPEHNQEGPSTITESSEGTVSPTKSDSEMGTHPEAIPKEPSQEIQVVNDTDHTNNETAGVMENIASSNGTSPKLILSSGAPTVEGPHRPPPHEVKRSPLISHQHESSYDSNDYLTLLGSAASGVEGHISTASSGPITNPIVSDDKTKEPDGDVYQSLSSFDSVISQDDPSQKDLSIQGQKNEQAKNKQTIDTTQPSSGDVPVTLHLAHTDSLVLPRNSPRKPVVSESPFSRGSPHPSFDSDLATKKQSTLLYKPAEQRLEKPVTVISSQKYGLHEHRSPKKSPVLEDFGFHGNIQSVVKKTPPKKVIIPEAFRN